MFDLLFQPYTFEETLKATYDLFGINNLILLGLSYFAIIVYVVRVPIMSPFSEEIAKSGAASFIQQLFYIISFIPFIKLLFGINLNYLFNLGHFALIYFAIVIPFFRIIKDISLLSTYESYIVIKKRRITLLDYKTLKGFTGLASFWIISIILFVYFTIFNPSLPLICWIFVFYSLASAFIIAALAHSFISYIKQSKYVHIETIEGKQFEGFLLFKDNDLYGIKTREGNILILAKQANNITIKAPPD